MIRAHERPLVDYIPSWKAARSAMEHRVVIYTAAALGDVGCAGYLTSCLSERDGDRVERVLREAMS